MRAAIHDTGVRSGDEALCEYGFQEFFDNELVNDAVAVGQGVDEALFRIVYPKLAIIAGRVASAQYLVLDFQQVKNQSLFKNLYLRPEPLVSAGALVRRQQSGQG